MSAKSVIVEGRNIPRTLAYQAKECDLVVLGLQHPDRRRRVFGQILVQVAQECPCALLLIGERG